MKRGLILLFVATVFSIATGFAAPVAVTKSKLHAGSAEIPVEIFEQPTRADRPVIIVLHGAGGTLFDGPEMRRVSEALAEQGNAVYFVHYFAGTGTIFARDATMQKNFGQWLATVREAITEIQKERGNSRRVGIYGYSLGAFLGLAASSDNPKIGALVEQAGGVWNNKMERIGRMPPVLMIHGRRDARVPFVKYAEPLIPVLRRDASSLETHFFPNEGHVFTQPAMIVVRADAARFFKRRLRGN